MCSKVEAEAQQYAVVVGIMKIENAELIIDFYRIISHELFSQSPSVSYQQPRDRHLGPGTHEPSLMGRQHEGKLVTLGTQWRFTGKYL